MKINHHIDDATALRYASGDLDEAFAVVVASHLASCAVCREAVRASEQIGGELLEDVGEVPLNNGALAAVMGRIEAGCKVDPLIESNIDRGPNGSADLPAPLQRYLENGLDGVRWKAIGPGVWRHRLDLISEDGGSLFLLKIAPGKKVPEHGHGGSEMTLILSGSYCDEFGRFAAGDIADLDEHVEHQPHVDSAEPCICLVATEAPTRFKGPFSRLMQPLVGI